MDGWTCYCTLYSSYYSVGFLIFIPIHIYLVIWSAIRFKHGALDVMFTGYDYHLKKEKKGKKIRSENISIRYWKPALW